MRETFIVDAKNYPELTLREREVMSHVLNGMTSKQIGHLLGVSHRTAELHRQRVMSKLFLKRPVELMRVWQERHRELRISREANAVTMPALSEATRSHPSPTLPDPDSETPLTLTVNIQISQRNVRQILRLARLVGGQSI